MSRQAEGGGRKAEGGEVHKIRLRGPWTLADGSRIRLPAIWRETLGDAESTILARAFHRPTNLDDGSSVFLRFDSPQRVERVSLNGAEVVDGGDLADRLTDSNRLTVDLVRHDPGGTLLEAWLEILER